MANTALDFGININAKRIVYGLDQFGEDELESIEKAAVETGSGDDTLFIADNGAGLRIDDIAYIDLGSQPDAGFDEIDLAHWTIDTFVDLSLDTVQWEESDVEGNLTTKALTVRHAEAAKGGKGDDVLLAGIVDQTVTSAGQNLS